MDEEANEDFWRSGLYLWDDAVSPPPPKSEITCYLDHPDWIKNNDEIRSQSVEQIAERIRRIFGH